MSRGFKTLLVVLTAAFALPGSASAATTSAGHLRVAIDSAARTADFTTTAARRNVVVLQEWEAVAHALPQGRQSRCSRS